MAYNEDLAIRLKAAFDLFPEGITEKKMFGGLAFLYKSKMTVGIVKNDLMVRVIAEKMEQELEKDFVRPMDFTKKPMKESIYVQPKGFKTEEELLYWVELGIEHAKYKLKE